MGGVENQVVRKDSCEDRHYLNSRRIRQDVAPQGGNGEGGYRLGQGVQPQLSRKICILYEAGTEGEEGRPGRTGLQGDEGRPSG